MTTAVTFYAPSTFKTRTWFGLTTLLHEQLGNPKPPDTTWTVSRDYFCLSICQT